MAKQGKKGPRLRTLIKTGTASEVIVERAQAERLSALCLSGGGCETVQDSRYAKLAGIPVPVLGLAGYGSVLVLVALDGLRSRVLAAGIAAGGLAFSLYLLVIQLVVIDAVCSWCVGNDVVIALLAVAAALRLRVADQF